MLQTISLGRPGIFGTATRGKRDVADTVHDAEAGITIQDALLNGVITLIILAVLIAVFFVVRGQFTGSNAQSEVVAIVNGIRSVNGGNPNYTNLTPQQVQTSGGLPSDVTVNTTLPGFNSNWAPGGITYTGNNPGFTLAFQASSASACTQIVNGEVGEALTIQAPAGTNVAANGQLLGTNTAASICAANPTLTMTFQ